MLLSLHQEKFRQSDEAYATAKSMKKWNRSFKNIIGLQENKSGVGRKQEVACRNKNLNFGATYISN